MAIFNITKKSSTVWQHGDDEKIILSDGYFRIFTQQGTGDEIFELTEIAGSDNVDEKVSDIRVIDETVGGSPESFTSGILLSNRLAVLEYPFFKVALGGNGAIDFNFACSDETSDLATGTVFEFILLDPIPSVQRVDFSVTTAPTGSTIILDVKKNGTTIYSTKPTIDATEFSTLTASTDQVLSGLINFIAGDKLEVVIDQVGSTIAGIGLKARLQSI